MEDARRKEIVAALNAKGVRNPCPRCGHKQFELVGQGLIGLNDDPNVMALGGPAVPIVIVACSNCGYISQHAQGALGLMKGVTSDK